MAYATENHGATFNDVSDLQQGKVHIKVEKNSRGFNWSCSAYGETVEDALREIDRLTGELSRRFGSVNG